MNDSEFIRRKVIEILVEEYELSNIEKEKYLLNEDYALFKQSFIDPFVDVFKIAYLGMKRTLTAANRVFLSLITFRASRMKELKREFEAKDAKIAGQMKSIADKAVESAGPGFGMVKFAFAPGMWVGEAAANAVDWEGTKDFLTNTGFNEWPILGEVIDAEPQTYWKEMSNQADMYFRESFKANLAAGTIVSVGTELAKLFIGSVNESKQNILEQNDDKKEKEEEPKINSVADLSGNELVEFTKQFFKKTGTFKAIEDWRRDWLEGRKEYFENFVGDNISLGKFIQSLANVATFDDLQNLVDEYDIKDLDLSEIKGVVESQMKEIMSSEEEVSKFLNKSVEAKQMKEEEVAEVLEKYKNNDPSTISDLEKRISKILWMGSKDDMMGEMLKGAEEIKQEVSEAYEELSFGDDKSLVSKTKDGKDYIDFVDSKKKEFDEAFQI